MAFLDRVVAWLNATAGVQFSGHGWIAAGLAVVGVLGIYIGLLYLMRLSHRTGHDDEVAPLRDTSPDSQTDGDKRD